MRLFSVQNLESVCQKLLEYRSECNLRLCDSNKVNSSEYRILLRIVEKDCEVLNYYLLDGLFFIKILQILISYEDKTDTVFKMLQK